MYSMPIDGISIYHQMFSYTMSVLLPEAVQILVQRRFGVDASEVSW